MKLLGRKSSKILIAIPTRGAMDSSFVHDLAMLVAHTTSVLDKLRDAGIGLSFCNGTYVHEQRNELVQEALRTEVDAVLWLDDDMRFPRDAALRLMKHRRMFIGANYPTRSLDCHPVAIKRIGTKDNPGEWLYAEGEGVVKAEAIGLGLALVHADVLHAVPYPWFEQRYDAEMRQWIGEDVDFCQKARKAGFDVEVDLDLSKTVKHVGRFEFSLEHARVFKEEVLGVKP